MHILIIGQNEDDIGPNGRTGRCRRSNVLREKRGDEVEEQKRHRNDGEDHEGS